LWPKEGYFGIGGWGVWSKFVLVETRNIESVMKLDMMIEVNARAREKQPKSFPVMIKTRC